MQSFYAFIGSTVAKSIGKREAGERESQLSLRSAGPNYSSVDESKGAEEDQGTKEKHDMTLVTENGIKMSANSPNNYPQIVELNVGGVFYSTSLATLTSDPGSRLAKIFAPDANEEAVLRDSKVQFSFVDYACIQW